MGLEVRPAGDADMAEAYAVFRRSLQDYLFSTGQVAAREIGAGELAEAWSRQQHWIRHLWSTAAHNCVAVAPDGAIAGWALSVERDGHLELTHFFVDPATQERGAGRLLLERVFPLGQGRHRSILATQDPRALGLYLRFGVGFAATSVEIGGAPRRVAVDTDLELERLAVTAAAVEAIGSVDEAVIGYRRDVDVEFLLGFRPAWLARRAGAAVGYAFGSERVITGPVAALDPADTPALLAKVEDEAAAAGLEEIWFTVPMVNRAAVAHLLARGFRLDPFFTAVLTSEPGMRLDRWVHTCPVFIL